MDFVAVDGSEKSVIW